MALGLAVCRVPPSLGLCALLPCSPLLHRGISRFHDSSSVTADVSLLAPSFPPHLFIPVKFPPLSFSVYPSLFLSLSFPPNPTIGSMVLLIVARASHAHHSRSRTRGYRTNAIIHDRCTTRPFLSLSRPLIFCPLILALWDSVISHRRGLLSAAGIDATKKCATASIADSETRFRRRSNGIARGDSFIVVQQHVVHNTRCNALFFLFLSGYCLYCAVNVDGIGRWDPAGNF